jgi:hypothetical protein
MAVTQEKGEPTVWDAAWREGYAKALEYVLGIDYKQAWPLAADFWEPPRTRRTRLARWLLRRGLT